MGNIFVNRHPQAERFLLSWPWSGPFKVSVGQRSLQILNSCNQVPS